MAFSFLEAIGGQPIYHKDVIVENLYYCPSSQTWTVFGSTEQLWKKDGSPVKHDLCHLSTDKPKKRIKKKMFINWYGKSGSVHDTEKLADRATNVDFRCQRIVIEAEILE